jgi:hypothetical protein
MNALVLPFCICLPFTHVLRFSTCGSGTSLLSAMYGPMGAAVSKILPAIHWLVVIWKSRALTSLMIVYP